MMKKLRLAACATILFASTAAMGSGEFTVTYTGPNIGNSETVARKVFTGMSVTDYRARAAAAGVFSDYVGNYTYINGGVRCNFHPIAQRRYVSNGKNRLQVTFQTYRQSSEEPKPYCTYEMTVIFEDRDGDVYAWVYRMLQTKIAEYEWLIGRDMYNILQSRGTGISYGTIGYDLRDIDGTYSKGFSIDHIVMERIAGPALTDGTDAAVAGDLTVAGDTAYIADGAAALGESTYSGNLTVDGTLTVRNPGTKTLSGKIKGMGDVTYQATGPRTDNADTVEVGADVYLNADWRRLASNRTLSSLTSVSVTLTGTRVGGDKTPAAYVHWRNNGGAAAVQIHNTVSSSYQTGVILYLRQRGRDIWGYINNYSFATPYTTLGISSSKYEYEMVNYDRKSDYPSSVWQSVTFATSPSIGQVGCHDLKLHFAEGSQPHVVKVTGQNTAYTGAVTRVVGTSSAQMMVDFATQVDDRALPKNGVLEVGRGGHAILSKQVSGEYCKAYDGGIIYQGSNNCFAAASTTSLILSNGTFVVGYQKMNTSKEEQATDAYIYLNHVSFCDGGRLVGCRPRIGYNTLLAPKWYIGGTSPSFASCGMALSPAKNSGPTPFVFEVEDVTKDDGVDFTMSGNIVLFYASGNENYESYRNMYILKQGAGTFSMAASYSPYQPTVISNGTWQIAAKNASSSSTSFELCGGSLSVLSNLTVKAGEIVPRVSSTISIGAGATLSIAAPSEDWADGVKLSVLCEDIEGRNAFRIGDSDCLTASQLAKIRINGCRVKQDAEGWVSCRVVGFQMSIR